jgi:hypothetical protein
VQYLGRQAKLWVPDLRFAQFLAYRLHAVIVMAAH